MQGAISKVEPTKSGKAWRVQVGTKWYNAQKKTGVDQMLGKTVEYDVESSEQFGVWMENLRIIEMPQRSVIGPTGGSPVTAEQIRAEQTRPSNGDRFYLPFVSNTVAHAIQVGACKTPEEVSRWAKAAYDAAQALDSL